MSRDKEKQKLYAREYRKKKHPGYLKQVEKKILKGLNNKRLMIERLGGKCAHCGGIFPPCVYDIHHTIPEKKQFRLNHLKFGSWEAIEEELKDCVLLCANCHRIEHHGQKNPQA